MDPYGRDARIPTETVLTHVRSPYSLMVDDYKEELFILDPLCQEHEESPEVTLQPNCRLESWRQSVPADHVVLGPYCVLKVMHKCGHVWWTRWTHFCGSQLRCATLNKAMIVVIYLDWKKRKSKKLAWVSAICHRIKVLLLTLGLKQTRM